MGINGVQQNIWTLYLGLLNEFYPTGKVLTISVYFVAVTVFSSPSVFCAKQVSNSTTRCHEQCINTIQYPLKCGCESRSRCTTVTLADVSNIGMGLGTPIFTLLWSISRPSPGISSAGVEPVRGAASFGGALVAQIHPRSHRSSRLAVVPGSQSIQFAIFAGTMVLIDHILDDLGPPLSTHVILIVFQFF